jgi:hypothetical protein
MKGKFFKLVLDHSEMFQCDHSHFEFSDKGLQIPMWKDEDIRWETTGVVMLRDSAKIMTQEEYKLLPEHFEDDWLDWEDLFYCLDEDYC